MVTASGELATPGRQLGYLLPAGELPCTALEYIKDTLVCNLPTFVSSDLNLASINLATLSIAPRIKSILSSS